MVLTRKHIVTLIFGGFLVALLAAFTDQEKLIDKSVSKVWKEEDVSKKELDIKDSLGASIGKVFELYIDDNKKGYACYTTAFGCRVGGCPKPTDPNTQTYETFDYIVVFDNSFSIQRVDIASYPGAYGFQICKPKWLKQFVGLTPSIKLYEDIDGISGATVSAQFLIDDINSVKKILQQSVN